MAHKLIKSDAALTPEQLYYIIDNLARSKTLEEVKKGFDRCYIHDELVISPDVVIRVAAAQADAIACKRRVYDRQFDDLRLGNPREAIKALEEIFELAMEDNIVGIMKGGEPITKKDLPTARACVTDAQRIRLNNLDYYKQLEDEGKPVDGEEAEKTAPAQVRIFHNLD